MTVYKLVEFFNWFRKYYSLNKLCYGQTDEQTDGQPENMMPTATKVGRGIEINCAWRGEGQGVVVSEP